MSTPQERAGGSLLLGTAKYLYTAYFMGGVLVAYLAANAVDMAWGEGHEQTTNAIGVAVGVVATYLGWRHLRLRTLTMEVIDELSAVTWPTRQEIQTNTILVIITSLSASLLVFLLDRMWNFLTDKIFLG
ncbi:MAG: preprotein translocase subunit SecE [Deltaproteobacteria bacterium]|nr:preprotein translocase subunit SecE [Deltaproteobacteria bacterium]